MRKLTTLFLATGFLLQAPAALACFPPVATFLSSTPTDGAVDVPRDAAIQLSWTSDWADDGWCSLVDDWAVEVRSAATDELIGGQLQMDWQSFEFCNGSIKALWQPDAAMPPNEVLHLNVVFQRDGLEPQSFSSTFTTGQQMVPSLSVLEPISVSHSVVASTWVSCMQPLPCGGGGGCVSETIKELVARVSVGAIEGGQAETGYVIEAGMAEDHAPTFGDGPVEAHRLSQGRSVGSGAGAVVELIIPDIGRPYVPCFGVRVLDASGKVAQVEPVCLDQMDPGALIEGSTQSSEPPSDAAEPEGSAPSSTDAYGGSEGCSVGSHAASSSAGLLAIFFLGVALRFRRRGGPADRCGHHKQSAL